jgi:hypothetical protein
MNAVMHRPHHKDAEEHPIWRERANKATDPGDNEKYPEDNRSSFKHRD